MKKKIYEVENIYSHIIDQKKGLTIPITDIQIFEERYEAIDYMDTIINCCKNNKIYFNEVNTIPGFTSISMYPMLWGAKGIDKPALISRLLELAHVREIHL